MELPEYCERVCSKRITCEKIDPNKKKRLYVEAAHTASDLLGTDAIHVIMPKVNELVSEGEIQIDHEIAECASRSEKARDRRHWKKARKEEHKKKSPQHSWHW